MAVPIQTEYCGYKFRSRLEARWAIFFDELGLRWDYEPEGYELPSGRYLPDFWIPHERSKVSKGYWVEIKGTSPSEVETNKCKELTMATGCISLIAVGIPDMLTDMRWIDIIQDDSGNIIGTRPGVIELPPAVLPFFNRYQSRISPKLFIWAYTLCGGQGPDFEWSRVHSAIDAAKSARFEYGETPMGIYGCEVLVT